MISEILSLDEVKLRRINKIIVHEIRRKSAEVRSQAAMQFDTGQKVAFKRRSGERMEGEIVKVNRTACKFRVFGGCLWNVDANLLTHA